MSNPIDRFKGCAKAEVSSGRTPNPELGKAVYLLNTARMKDGRTGGFRVEVTLTCLWGIEAGFDATGAEKGPDRPGTKVSKCLFSGDYFHKEFKDFSLKALGMDQSQELDIADMLCPASDYPGKSELERIEIMWEQKLPGQVCAFDENGAATEAGAFDGQVALEIGTTEKPPTPKLIDKSKGAVEGNFMFDASANKIMNPPWRNSYFNRNVGKDEIRENLDDKDICRFFGSMEAFESLEM